MERQDPILGRGWSFPMTTESRGPILVGGAEKVEQSLRLILFTTPGERVLRPEFGCGLRDLVFRPNTTTFRAQVADNVRTAIQRWEPRVDLIDVLVETSAIAPTLVDLHIAYRLRATNQVFNQVYPLVLSEGEDATPGDLVRVGTA
ncbi:MAG TPA: GPW/gp25 family protein [Kiloniellaceae bacterium]